MDIIIKGVKAPTKEFKKKLKAYRALEEAGIAIPDELDEFFAGEEPDEDGVIVEIEDAVSGDVMYDDGVMTIDLSKLPDGLTHIKVIGSY